MSELVLYGIKDSWLPCTERSYYRLPYGIRLLAKQFLGAILDIEVDQSAYRELLDVFLLYPDIKINKTTDAGGVYMLGLHWTALMFACHRGNSAIVSRLVQVPGLDINYQADWSISMSRIVPRSSYASNLMA